MNEDRYIQRIKYYIKKINRYMSNIQSFEEFILNEEKVDAVMLNLEQIGETAKKLSNDVKNRYPTIQWSSIIGLRNLISHEYEGINLEIIYFIAVKEIKNVADKL